MVVRAARPLGNPRRLEFRYDFRHRAGLRNKLAGARPATQRAVTLAGAPVEIKVGHGNRLAFDVFPDVGFGPLEERMDPQMRVWRKVGLELVPQFRRLVLDIPLHCGRPGTEHTFLGPRRFLVTADANDHRPEAMAVEGLPERILLKQRTALHARQFPIGEGGAGGERLFVARHHQFQTPIPNQPVPERNQFRDLVTGVEVHQRKRNVPEEGLAREPEDHIGIFADAPEHGHFVEVMECLTQNVDASIFQQRERVAPCGRTRSFRAEARRLVTLHGCPPRSQRFDGSSGNRCARTNRTDGTDSGVD